jgi:hypothetical protein
MDRTLRRVVVQMVALVGLVFALVALHWAWVVRPVHRWTVLHAVYSDEQIAEQHITIARLIRPHAAVFSNGERHDYGFWPEFLAVGLWLIGALIAFGVIALISRKVFPRAHARMFPGTREHHA